MALGAGFMCLTACGFTPLYETSSFSLKIAVQIDENVKQQIILVISKLFVTSYYKNLQNTPK